MKKALKITWISLASLLGVVLIVAIVAFYIVLTPKRVTSIVNKQAPNFLTCDFSLGKADITLFKTFPDIGVEISDVVLVNPMKGSPSDTLASIKNAVVSMNVKQFLFNDEIIINGCQLENGNFNVFFDAEGNSNLDIATPSETEEPEEDSKSTLGPINLKDLKLKNINVVYTDLSSGMSAKLNDLNLIAKGGMTSNSTDGNIDLIVKNIEYKSEADSSFMAAVVKDFMMKGKGGMKGENANADVEMTTGGVSFESSENQASAMAARLNSTSLSYKGAFNNYDFIDGLFTMNLNNIDFVMDDETFAKSLNVDINTPIQFSLNTMQADLGRSSLKINDIVLGVFGHLEMNQETDAIALNMDLNTNDIDVENTILLIPESLRKEMLSGIDVKGTTQLSAHVEGEYSETSMPVVNADLQYGNGALLMPELLPYPVTALNASVHADLDLNGKSDVKVNSLNAKMKNNSFAVSGIVNDVLGAMLCNLNLKADTRLDELKSFIPDDISAKGRVKADVNARCTLAQLTDMDLMKTNINGTLNCTNLDVVYFDTILLNTSNLDVAFAIPNPAYNTLKNGLATVSFSGDNLDAEIVNMMNVKLKDFNLEAQTSNVLDESKPMAVYADYGFGNIDFNMDDMALNSENASGTVAMLPSNKNDNTSYIVVYSGDSLSFNMGEEMEFSTESLSVDAMAEYDENEENILSQWNPYFNINLSNALFDMEGIKAPVLIPKVDCNYSKTGLDVNEGNVIIGDSDFTLKGELTGIEDWIKDEGLLEGTLDFTSDYTDVNELMDFFSGMGDTLAMEEPAAVTDSLSVEEGDPFMVPKGAFITLNTSVKTVKAGETMLENLGGKLTVKDGILVLEEMGFTSNAATMLLTAIYKSPRKNHLFAGIDFHLLDIDIAEMIRIIPDLDTIVPMLKSFAGKAEFHLAAETYMKSDYSLKMSTLMGAAAIEGKDLVVLDSETFDMISKYLLFKKSTENKIDSLDVEMTVFRNEVDLYPFLISMDKYQAVLAGRHNLDMTFDYNISVLSPAVVNRLGLEVTGNLDDLHFKLKKGKHANLYKPQKRDHVDNEILKVKKLIADSLKANVKK